MLPLATMDHCEGIITVAVPAPLYQCYDYLPPADCPLTAIRPGMRLRVPFGRSTKIALVLGSAARSEVAQHRLKRARALLDREPLLPPAMLSLLQWAADYYHHPLGEVIFSALPALLREGHPPLGQTRRRYRLTPAGNTLDPGEPRRAPRQAALLELLRQHPEGLEQSWLQAQGGDWRGALRALETKGWLAREDIADHDIHCGEPAGDYRPHPLHIAQQAAADAVCQGLGQFRPFLLEGVTGSGKTEVYLHIIEQVVQRGLQALVLIPEIGLTPQLVQRFREHLRLPLAVLHSGLTDRQRLHAWVAALQGEAPVVIGTRSAVFTPLRRPGVIIIDEEHDPSFKQQDGFRYHARDIAVMRARRCAIPVVLGSATPSLESLHNAATGRYGHLRLERRAGGATPPHIRLIDIRHQRLDHGLSPPLLSAVGEHLRDDHQVLKKNKVLI
ncbi:MAG: primosomal protein N' [Gammaproteobacteria bacterium]